MCATLLRLLWKSTPAHRRRPLAHEVRVLTFRSRPALLTALLSKLLLRSSTCRVGLGAAGQKGPTLKLRRLNNRWWMIRFFSHRAISSYCRPKTENVPSLASIRMPIFVVEFGLP